VSIVQHGLAVPAGESPLALIKEMNALLASPDPMLRDEVGYSVPARWIVREKRLSPDEVRQVLAMWTANLKDGIGETGTDRVLLRSFSALNLSLIAALENEAPFLEPAEFERFFESAIAYFEAERDVRGYDPRVGWMHSPAHTADLLKFLARSPKLPKPAQARLLEAIARKISAVGGVFVWGEDERIAAVVRSLARRSDLDEAALDSWLTRFVEGHKALWAKAPSIDPAAFSQVQNAKQVLRSLHAVLAMDPKPTRSVESAKVKVLAALAKMS
jgi:hypothetical protein